MISILGSFPDSFLVNKLCLAYNDEINLKWEILETFQLT